MEEKELEEIFGALDILNKYRNYWYKSNDDKEQKIFQMIDKFLPEFHNELIEDKLAQIVAEKIRSNKNGRK